MRESSLHPAADLHDSSTLEGIRAAVVLVTEWPEFAELDWAGDIRERMRTPLVVDGRNFLDHRGLVAAGFTYEGVGRPRAALTAPSPA